MTDITRTPRRLTDFGELYPAEKLLLERLDTAEGLKLGDEDVASWRDDATEYSRRRIRASLIRYLLGDIHPEDQQPNRAVSIPLRLHETGLQIWGAVIESDLPDTGEGSGLSLENMQIDNNVMLLCCLFDQPLILREAKIKNLLLNVSYFARGIVGDGMALVGRLQLTNSKIDGACSLIGATIGGDFIAFGLSVRNTGQRALVCDQALVRGGVFLEQSARIEGECRFHGATVGGGFFGGGLIVQNAGHKALSCDRISVNDSVFLDQSAVIEGECRFLGATIGGNFSASGLTVQNVEADALTFDGIEVKGSVFLNLSAKVYGASRFVSAVIGRNLSIQDTVFKHRAGTAFNALRLTVTGSLLFEPVKIQGAVDMRASQIGYLHDKPSTWPDKCLFDRMQYQAFIACPTDAKTRIKWLEKQSEEDLITDFKPQPWQQCARVLAETGHQDDAKAVLRRMEYLYRRVRRQRKIRLMQPLHWLKDSLLRVTIGYGHNSLWAFRWLIGIWVLGALVFQFAWNQDHFSPNHPTSVRAPEWVLCGDHMETVLDPASIAGMVKGRRISGESKQDCYLAQVESENYPAFNAWIYSADTLLPFVDLEMQDYWLPDGRGWPGQAGRWYLWFHILAGWALSLLAVAGFSGLVKST